MKMNRRRKSERGQALILIALAVVGLLGLTALAVDGGHVFAQRRQAQNAADTAAFAAAVAIIDGNPATDYIVDGRARASSNGFTDGSNATVTILNPPDSDAPPAYVNNDLYVQAKITADVQTFFARIVGVNSIPIHVQAVAKADPPHPVKIGGNNGLVALGDICNAVRTHGSGTTTLVGGGVFSNSSSAGNPAACYSFNGMGTGLQIHLPNADMVGCLDTGDVGTKIIFDGGGTYNCSQTGIFYPPPVPDLGFTCDQFDPGYKSGDTVYPGRWSHSLGNLPGSGNFPPSGTKKIMEGVYCITGTFNIGASDDISSVDSGGNPGRVTFVLNGSARWNAGATINLLPTWDPDNTLKINGLLIYRPLNIPDTGLCPGGNGTPPCQVLEFNGGADTHWSGTIYAPDSECDINGTSGTWALDAQAICYKIDIGGDAILNLTYNGDTSWPLPVPGRTELNR